jgi:hypothetical protein
MDRVSCSVAREKQGFSPIPEGGNFNKYGVGKRASCVADGREKQKAKHFANKSEIVLQCAGFNKEQEV